MGISAAATKALEEVNANMLPNGQVMQPLQATLKCQPVGAIHAHTNPPFAATGVPASLARVDHTVASVLLGGEIHTVTHQSELHQK